MAKDKKKAPKNRVAKTDTQLLRDLDDHLYLLRSNLRELRADLAHIKVLAAELRVLVCFSSGTDGLLWRLIDKFHICEDVAVIGPIGMSRELFSSGIFLAHLPLLRAPIYPREKERARHGLRKVIKETPATCTQGKAITHEELIKSIAQQIGSAHEDNGIDQALIILGGLSLNGVEAAIAILALDAELVLEVGDRVIEHAEAKLGYKRRPQGHGDVTVAVHLGPRLTCPVRRTAFLCYSPVNALEIKFLCDPSSRIFSVWKHGKPAGDFAIPLVPLPAPDTQELFAWSYSSDRRLVRVLSSAAGACAPITCDLGWADFHWLKGQTVIGEDHIEFADLRQLTYHCGLLSVAECRKLLETPPPAQESDEDATKIQDANTSPFPD